MSTTPIERERRGEWFTSRYERWLLCGLAALSLILRTIAFFRYRFDSDEPQHLHVAWGWSAGLVQYRDLFDNHAPLFHILTAPFLAALGERANILLYMRLLMLPLFAAVVAATYLLGHRLYDARTGTWAAVLLSLFPQFLLKSLEFRTDNLWNTLWMVTLVVITGGRITAARAFAAGLLLGTALCVSLKTTLLLATLLLAGIVAELLLDGTVRRVTRAILPALGGFVIVPAIVTWYFAAVGALVQMRYCVLTFNELVARTHHYVWVGRTLYPFLFAIVIFVALRWVRRHPRTGVRRRRFYFGVATAIFVITLGGFWILISPRDFLPVMPLFFIFGVAAVFRAQWSENRRLLTFAAVVVAMLASLSHYAPLAFCQTNEHITFMHQVLGLTRPGEPIMDLKGESVYRRRPFYNIFEFITREQMQGGLIPDTLPEAVVAARCHVAQEDGTFFPTRGRAFLSANFLDVGRLRVSGQRIDSEGRFSIAVPGPYVVIDARGEVAGVLDGTDDRGPRELGIGPHRFEPAHPGAPLACIWAPALQRGYSPFHPRDREF